MIPYMRHKVNVCSVQIRIFWWIKKENLNVFVKRIFAIEAGDLLDSVKFQLARVISSLMEITSAHIYLRYYL